MYALRGHDTRHMDRLCHQTIRSFFRRPLCRTESDFSKWQKNCFARFLQLAMCIVHISGYVLSTAFIRCDSDQNVIYNETTSCTIYYFLINYCKYGKLSVSIHVFFWHVHLLYRYHITRLFILFRLDQFREYKTKWILNHFLHALYATLQ